MPLVQQVFFEHCFVPGSVLGSADSRINQMWFVPMRIHSLGRGASQQTLMRYFGKGSGTLKMQNPTLLAWGWG